ncbi:DsbA family protein [Pantoea sp. SoEX]|uniref:DsbA family protein n=1 Tax=Pantoea sp. SoEX TaxID=2576763 RepID=UPI00135A11B8|nr:DsbA family protein [Pantoea sp. SoEX]MXP51188.1 thiol:disulfide interchange protein DsbA [Pantoea sp. SoEX]
MKRIYIMFIGILITFNVFATQFIEGKHYITLSKPLLNQPQVVEFFSFFCKYCYKLENQLSDYPAPKKIKISKYHIDYMGKDSVITHAWAIAIALGVEDKVMKPIFNSTKQMQDLTNTDIVKNIFLKTLNISSEEYEALWNSYTVKILIDKQKKASEDFNILNIPVTFVKGKYMININELEIEKNKNNSYVIKNYFDIIEFLINKK